LLSTINEKAHGSLGPENGREGVDEENVPLLLIEIGDADALAAKSIASTLVETNILFMEIRLLTELRLMFLL
jgi:hypothetical protein